MKILLIQPPLVSNLFFCFVNYYPEPLALQLLAANLSNQDVFLVDLRFSDDLPEKLQNIQPDLVGITCGSMTEVPIIKEVSNIVKKIDPNIFVVVGGQYPTLVPQDFIDSNIDFIVFGEGEITFSELVDTLETNGKNVDSVKGIGIISNNHAKKTKPRQFINDIDLLLLPDRDLICDYKHEYYNSDGRNVTSMLTTRGCPYTCAFCSIWRFYHGTYRERSPENIYKEIENCDEELIHFVDDNFLYNIQRSWKIVKLLNRLKKKKKYVASIRSDIPSKYPELISAWVDIGLDTVSIGIESFKPKDLKDIRKNTSREINDKTLEVLKNLPLKIMPYFIISPYYDEGDFDELIEYIENWDLRYPLFTVLTPLPGTVLYDQMKSEIIMKEHRFFDLLHPVVRTHLPYKEFMDRFLGLYKKFYFNNDLTMSGTYCKVK